MPGIAENPFRRRGGRSHRFFGPLHSFSRNGTASWCVPRARGMQMRRACCWPPIGGGSGRCRQCLLV